MCIQPARTGSLLSPREIRRWISIKNYPDQTAGMSVEDGLRRKPRSVGTIVLGPVVLRYVGQLETLELENQPGDSSPLRSAFWVPILTSQWWSVPNSLSSWVAFSQYFIPANRMKDQRAPALLPLTHLRWHPLRDTVDLEPRERTCQNIWTEARGVGIRKTDLSPSLLYALLHTCCRDFIFVYVSENLTLQLPLPCQRV